MGRAEAGWVLRKEGLGVTLPPPTTRAPELTQAGVLSPWCRLIRPLLDRSAVMAEQQTATCQQCSRTISPEDTIIFGHGRLGHLDCRRPRVLSAEERALLFTYCRNHHVADCVRCAEKFHLREVASRDLVGILTSGCPWCHTDLTESIRAHLYGCAILPAEVRRRAQVSRETARSLVKQSQQLHDAADLAIREAEAALHALRETLSQSPIRRAD
jgi:hypothetical protein